LFPGEGTCNKYIRWSSYGHVLHTRSYHIPFTDYQRPACCNQIIPPLLGWFERRGVYYRRI